MTGGGGGGGAAWGTSTDRLLLSVGGWLGIGGGTARGTVAEGMGGGMLGGASRVGDWSVLSSTLESLVCAFKASLCGTDEPMSVS